MKKLFWLADNYPWCSLCTAVIVGTILGRGLVDVVIFFWVVGALP